MTLRLRRGMNIGGWLSQSHRRGAERAAFFGPRDVRKLAALGFDHLRLPVDEEQLWDEAGRREPEAWDLLNASLDWCAEQGLKAVVDLHILRSHFFNAAERPLFADAAAPERFADRWRDLSAALRGRPTDAVAYELLNEPVADDPGDWNRVYAYPYRALREAEPARTIVLGSNLWNQTHTFASLKVPDRDPHLILTFHYYNPMHVTHYRAAWVKECAAYDGPIQYPGLPIPQDAFDRLAPPVQSLVAKWNRHYDDRVMEGDLLWPLAVARRTGLPLYCGEFGVIHNAPQALADAWNHDFIRVIEGLGIGWANWSYKGGFGILDRNGNPTPTFHAVTGA
jgi:endoglucanase